MYNVDDDAEKWAVGSWIKLNGGQMRAEDWTTSALLTRVHERTSWSIRYLSAPSA